MATQRLIGRTLLYFKFLPDVQHIADLSPICHFFLSPTSQRHQRCICERGFSDTLLITHVVIAYCHRFCTHIKPSQPNLPAPSNVRITTGRVTNLQQKDRQKTLNAYYMTVALNKEIRKKRCLSNHKNQQNKAVHKQMCNMIEWLLGKMLIAHHLFTLYICLGSCSLGLAFSLF